MVNQQRDEFDPPLPDSARGPHSIPIPAKNHPFMMRMLLESSLKDNP